MDDAQNEPEETPSGLSACGARTEIPAPVLTIENYVGVEEPAEEPADDDT